MTKRRKQKGILVLADDEYVSIPPAEPKSTPRSHLRVRYYSPVQLKRLGGLRLYEPHTEEGDPLRGIELIAVVDALPSEASRDYLKKLIRTNVPVLIVVASTSNLYDDVYNKTYAEEVGLMSPQPGKPANILRLVPSNAVQAWTIASWLRTYLSEGDHVAVVHSGEQRRSMRDIDNLDGLPEEDGKERDADRRERLPRQGRVKRVRRSLQDIDGLEGLPEEDIYEVDLDRQLRLALEGHGFKAVRASMRGDSLLLSRRGRPPDKLRAAIVACYPPKDPRRFLTVLASCTDRVILPDAWEPVRMAGTFSADISTVFVARSPEDRVADAIESIDEAMHEERQKQFPGRRRTLTEGGRPRVSFIERIKSELERLLPPAYRFEKAWQNMGFGYELVPLERARKS